MKLDDFIEQKNTAILVWKNINHLHTYVYNLLLVTLFINDK